MNTPRVITDQNVKVVWRWDNTDPFGDNLPNQDPNNTGNQFVFNLRYPGMYSDVETGLFHNGYRDYDPTGHYVQSDPLGLFGGSSSTYIYANANPLNKIDPSGLAWSCRWAGIVLICSSSDPTIPPGVDSQSDSYSYHNYVYQFLDARTANLEGQAYTDALQQGLRELGAQIRTPGSYLNNLITK